MNTSQTTQAPAFAHEQAIALVAHAYAEAALWTEGLDNKFGVSDLGPEARESIAKDCQEFVLANRDLLSHAGANLAQTGHDLWLTRNRHGAGFWDRGYGEVGEELTQAAHEMGESSVYETEGVIYVS